MTMRRGEKASLPKARILGPKQMVTLEDPANGKRCRVEVRSRRGRKVTVSSVADAEVSTVLSKGATVRVRVARPFGLFRYSARVLTTDDRGVTELQLDAKRPRRKQEREFFRLPVRLSVHASNNGRVDGMMILRALDLSAGGILLLDPDHRLSLSEPVALGMPIGRSGELMYLKGRVVREHDEEGRLALSFDQIGETARQTILRYLFREHRRRGRTMRSTSHKKARITEIRERP